MRNKNLAAAIVLAVSVLMLATAAVSAGPATQPATTQPVIAGRDTPAGAMTAYEHAIEIGDVATVVDSFNAPADTIRSGAQAMVLQARFIRALNAHFGHEKTATFSQDCNLHPQQTGKKYTEDEWTIRPASPDEADSMPESHTPYLYRGSDGIWRMGAIFRSRTHVPPATGVTTGPVRGTRPARVRQTTIDPTTSRMEQMIPDIEAGKYATIEDVEKALYPEGTPMARMRQMEQEQKQQQEQAEKAQEQAILAAHFDPSTLEGAIGAYVQVVTRRDPNGMASLMFLKDAPDDSYSVASAKRLFAMGEFHRAVTDHIDPKGSALANSFGFENDAAFVPSLAWDQPQQHGEVGLITRGGERQPAAWYRKVGGVWKQEVKLQLPSTQTLASHTKDVQDDTAALQRITADINAGKLTTNDHVRDSLGNAGLNCFSDPTFTLDFEYAYPNQIKPHDRPANPPVPTDPKTPAGAMNRFIRALESGDEKTARDCLWVPNDKNGAAAAMAHDYVAGVRFARALQKDSPGWDPNYFCHNCAVIQPESLRDYSEDEWMIDPSHPDIAVSNQATIARPDPRNGQDRQTFTMVHEWTPIMHRGADTIWRLGPWYPQSAHQLQERTPILAAKDQILDKATADLNADKVRTIDDLGDLILPQLKALGAAPVTTMQP